MNFICCDESFNNSTTVIFGAPFDGTTSYRPGARFAPAAIRNESYGLETYSPYQQKDLEQTAVHDAGDLELPFGNTQRVLDMIESFTDRIFRHKKIPFMLGGEHLVTLGAVRSAVKFHPNLHIIHFDAHADLRDDYLGEKLSHATVMRRCHELTGDGRIYQLGIRSGDKSEFQFAANHTNITMFNTEKIGEKIQALKGVPVYLTVDLDIIDPCAFPGTGTPEAGGITFMQLLEALLQCGGLNVVGVDVNELSPNYDHSGASTALACKIVRELLLEGIIWAKR